MGLQRLQAPVTLPAKQDLTLAFKLSLVIVALTFVVSIAGLLFRDTIYPTAALRKAFLPSDVVNLLVGLPILLACLWLAQRGNLAGLLFWPGALFFVFYNYLVYLFAMPLGILSLCYLALVALSLYTLLHLLTRMNRETVGARLQGNVPEKLPAGVLVGFGLLFFLRAVGMLITAILNQTLLPAPELALHVTDALTTPVWIIGGVLLWQRKPLGYLTGLGLLFQASMLFIGLLIFMLLQPLLTTAPFVLADFAVIFVMGLICFIPFLLFVRGVARS